MSERCSKGIVGMVGPARASTYTSIWRQHMPPVYPCDALSGSVRQGGRAKQLLIWDLDVYVGILTSCRLMHRDKSPSRRRSMSTCLLSYQAWAQSYPRGTGTHEVEQCTLAVPPLPRDAGTCHERHEMIQFPRLPICVVGPTTTSVRD